jgi:hypothetical protein
MLKKMVLSLITLLGFGYSPLVGIFECGNEPLGAIIKGDFWTCVRARVRACVRACGPFFLSFNVGILHFNNH